MSPFDFLLKNPLKIQEQLSGFQEKLGNIVKTGTAGGGLVEIDINGKLEVLAVRIAPQAMNIADTEMLQDLIMAAFTDGMTRVKEAVSTEAAAITGGLNIPGFPGGM
ncbi:hypothetical protein R84B8_03277 [Treponema sp. R8-4-B8]